MPAPVLYDCRFICSPVDVGEDDCASDENKARKKTNTICEKFSVDNRIINKLVLDCIYQVYLYASEDGFFGCSPVENNYFKMFYRSDDIVDTVQAYTCPRSRPLGRL